MILDVEDLEVRLGSRSVVRGVGLSVEPGTILGVIGPNGAGKSTLLRTLAGLLPKNAGTISLEGQPLSRWSDAERSRRIGYVPQRSELRSGLFVQRVVELSRYAHRGPLAAWTAADRDAVDSALEQTDAKTLAPRRFTELSEGERRRVLIARALATGARCLLLDEPTSALDVAHALALFRVLRTLRDRGYGIVVVLHDINEAYDLADRALVLADGQPIAEGGRDAVFTPAVIHAAFGVDLVPGAAFGYRARETP